MNKSFTLAQFRRRFPSDDVCLEEIKKMVYPAYVWCNRCEERTKHYKIKGRSAYTCKYCRNQWYPLKGTIFEKSTTPLTLWFYAIFLMTHTKARISIRELQQELGVTYKTAWRMYTGIKILMKKNNGDLLVGPIETEQVSKEIDTLSRRTWTIFKTLHITVSEKEEH